MKQALRGHESRSDNQDSYNVANGQEHLQHGDRGQGAGSRPEPREISSH